MDAKNPTLKRSQTLRYLSIRKESLKLKRYADRLTQVRMSYAKFERRFSDSGESFVKKILELGFES